MFSFPFNQVGGNKILTRGLLKANKLSFNGIITNLEKTVSTINQVIPLYNQVKPLVNTSKSLVSSLKKVKPAKKVVKQKKDFNPDIIDATITTPSYKTNTSPINTEVEIFKDTSIPNKPFFNLA